MLPCPLMTQSGHPTLRRAGLWVLYLRREAWGAGAPDAIKEAGFKPRSAQINARGPVRRSADISERCLPPAICSAAASCHRLYVRRAARPALFCKCSLTVSAAETSSLVLGPASIVFKQTTPELRICSQYGYTLIGGVIAVLLGLIPNCARCTLGVDSTAACAPSSAATTGSRSSAS